MPLHTLVSGFGPFGNVIDNPTERLCTHFRTETVPGHRITTCPLPTSFERAVPLMIEAIARGSISGQPFDFILMLGVAARSTAWRVETQGLNQDAPSIVDIDGRIRDAGEIIPGAPARLPVSLPVDPVERAIASTGAPVVVSLSAGTYLCNHLLYQVLYHLQNRDVTGKPADRVPVASESQLPPRAGFLHVPADEQTFGAVSHHNEQPIFPFSQHIRVLDAVLTACTTL